MIRRKAMSKRRNKKPLTNGFVKAYLKDYSEKVKFKKLVDLLRDHIDIPTDMDELSCYLLRAYQITVHVIGQGIKDNTMTDEQAVERIDKFIENINTTIGLRYKEFSAYCLTGVFGKWNVISQFFLLKMNLLLIRNSIKNYTFENPEQCATELMCMVYDGKKIENYTQQELYDIIYTLAAKWKYMEYSPDVDTLLDALQFRASIICVGLHTDAVFDSEHPNHRIVHKEEKGQYAAAIEFISDIASMFSLFQRSIQINEFFAEEFEIYDFELDNSCKGFDVPTCCNGLLEWIIEDELPCLSDGKIKQLLKNTMLNMCLRPGEKERYARFRGGVFVKDPITVMEHCRTSQQVYHWNQRFDGKDIKSIMEKAAAGVKDMVFNIILAKIFDMYWDRSTDGEFKWWANTIITEKDFFDSRENIIQHEMPIIVEIMGEWNVFYEKILIRTITMDVAIVLWTIILFRKCNSTYKNYEVSINVAPVGQLLEKWSVGQIVLNEENDLDEEEENVDPMISELDKMDKIFVNLYKDDE